MAETATILVVGPARVGDMVMSQSLFMTLKSRQPERLIDVLAPVWSLPLIVRMPEVRAGIDEHLVVVQHRHDLGNEEPVVAGNGRIREGPFLPEPPPRQELQMVGSG